MTFQANIARAPIASAAITTESALALYGLARTTGAPAAYETAAHALAAALTTQQGLARAFHRPRPAPTPAADPAPQSAPAAKVARPRSQSARKMAPGEDLAAALPRPPRAKAATGVFVCRWADGSETRVSALVFHSAKPHTRWAAAFQAADRLRRSRSREEYAQSFPAACELKRARWTAGPCGVRIETQEWLRLLAVRPMAALAQIVDETTGETFTPSATFGAGDPVEAGRLEAEVCDPITPWQEARATGWTVAQRRYARAHITAAFEARARKEAAPQGPISLGASCAGQSPTELAGARVGLAPSDAARVVAETPDRSTMADVYRKPYGASLLRVDVKQQLARVEAAGARVWTVRRDVGGHTATLIDGAQCLRLGLQALAALRFVRDLRAVA